MPARVFMSILLLFYVSLIPLGNMLFLIMDLDPPESYNTLSKREQGRPCILLTNMMPQAIGVVWPVSSVAMIICGSSISASISASVSIIKSVASSA